ncbi:MAG: hypothetical protein ACOY94_13445 [Bacillota bacterium]
MTVTTRRLVEAAGKQHGTAPFWNPEEGVTILQPEVPTQGYWVGCPSIIYDADRNSYLMTYRRRRPRGLGAERGWHCAIAESTDGISFADIWALHKDQLTTPSMERFSIVKDGGRYLLYLSYVDPADNRWRIDMLEASSPDQFNVARLRRLFDGANTGTEGIKDPHVFKVGPLFHMLASFASVPKQAMPGMHATADIYNTGVTTSPTGLAISRDGLNWEWQGEIMPVGEGWDRYMTRLTCILHNGAAWLSFYDGSAGVEENYEERCGLALSYDLRNWIRVTTDAPWVVSPHATGSVRYVDVLPLAAEIRIYYEYVRPDGAHELRMNRLPVDRARRGEDDSHAR